MTFYRLEITYEDGPCTSRPYTSLEEAKKIYDLAIKNEDVKLAKIFILGGPTLYTYVKKEKENDCK